MSSLRGGLRFRVSAARTQKHRPLAFVVGLHEQVGRQRKRRFEQGFGTLHLTRVLKRGRQQSEIVLEVPVVLGRNLFLLRILAMQPIGSLELGDRLVHPAAAAQAMAVHVARVRHLRCLLREGR